MDPEDRIRDALRAEPRKVTPSPTFSTRVMAALPAEQDRPGRTRTLAFELLAACLAVALVGVVLGPRFLPSAGVSPSASGPSVTAVAEASTPAATATASASPIATPTVSAKPAVAVTSVNVPNPFGDMRAGPELTFKVPATWTTATYNFVGDERASDESYIPILSTGTGRVTPSCAVLHGCSSEWNLPEGGVEIRVDFDWHQGTFDGCCKGIYSGMTAVTEPAPAGSEPIQVGGTPARVTRIQGGHVELTGETIPGADVVLLYRLIAPQRLFFGWVVVAAIRGPNVEAREAEVAAVLDSLQFVPKFVPLPTDAASAGNALAMMLNLLDHWSGLDGSQTGRECFTSEPGKVTAGSITRTVFATNRGLTQPLAVRCSADVEATPVGFWKVVFHYAWDPAGGQGAGEASQTYLVEPDGSMAYAVAEQVAPTNEDAMPFIQPRHPNNPG